MATLDFKAPSLRERGPTRSSLAARMKSRISRAEFAWILLPALIVYAVFVLYPSCSAFVLSLYDWTGIGSSKKFIGLGNFGELLTSGAFWSAAEHTATFFIAIAIFQTTVALYLATLLNKRPRFHTVYRLLLFLPVTLSLVNTGFMWQLMLSIDFGLINPILNHLGLHSLTRPWLADPHTALPAVILVQAWQWMGLPIVVFLAGLQSVRQDLLESAALDGAGRWLTFRTVTFRQLAPVITAITVLCFIRMFKVFDIVYVLEGPTGSPVGSTSTIDTLTYSSAFGATSYSTNLRMGYAMAIATTSAIFMLIAGGALLAYLRRRERDAV